MAALRLQKFAGIVSRSRSLFRDSCRFSSSQPAPSKVDPPVFNKNKAWTSWGFDDTDYLKDRYGAHCIFFSFITLFGFGYALYFAYYPDFRNADWAQREAYLLIREREAAGLPLIDRNYIPPEKVVLPTDEELGDFEIII